MLHPMVCISVGCRVNLLVQAPVVKAKSDLVVVYINLGIFLVHQFQRSGQRNMITSTAGGKNIFHLKNVFSIFVVCPWGQSER